MKPEALQTCDISTTEIAKHNEISSFCPVTQEFCRIPVRDPVTYSNRITKIVAKREQA